MAYSYKQWSQDQTADNVIHASDLERWQDGITDAGGTWDGSWTDEKDTLTADQLNALEREIETLADGKWTAKTWEDGNVPGTEEWNRIELGIFCAQYGAGSIIESGACGPAITYILFDNKKLVFIGTGTMAAYDDSSNLTPFLDKDYTDVIIESGITNVGAYIFYNCTQVESVSLGDAIERITVGAFWGCTGLIEIEMPDSVTNIGASSFRDSSLISVIIPPNVDTVSSNAFRTCRQLKTVIFTGDAPGVSTNPFYGVTATVYYPSDKDGWDTFDFDTFSSNATLTWIAYNSADGLPEIEETATPQSVEDSDEIPAVEAGEIE